MVTPTNSIADGCAYEHPGPEYGCRVIVIRIGRGVMINIGCGLVYDHSCRIIRRNIDHFWRGRFNLNDLFFLNNDRLFIGIQIACCVGCITKLLNSFHNIVLLTNDSFSQFPGPFQITVHLFNYFRIIK